MIHYEPFETLETLVHVEVLLPLIALILLDSKISLSSTFWGPTNLIEPQKNFQKKIIS